MSNMRDTITSLMHAYGYTDRSHRPVIEAMTRALTERERSAVSNLVTLAEANDIDPEKVRWACDQVGLATPAGVRRAPSGDRWTPIRPSTPTSTNPPGYTHYPQQPATTSEVPAGATLDDVLAELRAIHQTLSLR